MGCAAPILLFTFSILNDAMFVQTLSMFGALNFSSLYLVLAWVSLMPAALMYNIQMTRTQAER